MITHVEHSLALAPQANGLTDQIARACAVADHAIGEMRAILERKGLLDDTTIVLFGDHGDDFWSHGYKGGMIHGTEPYTDILRTPLAIRDASLRSGTVGSLASTIDLAPTCLALLGIDPPLPFAHSGCNLLERAPQVVFSQNYTANQPDHSAHDIVQAHAAIDDTHALVTSSRGIELYAYQLDPGNHCNLLHLLARDATGRLTLPMRPGAAGHFRAALQENPRAVVARCLEGCRIVLSPFFDVTSLAASLWFARESFGGPLTIVHGDLVFSDELIGRRLAAPGDTLIGYDSTIRREHKINVHAVDGALVDFGEGIPTFSGLYAGWLRLSAAAAARFRAALEQRIQAGFNPANGYDFFAVRTLVAAPGGMVRGLDIAGGRWQEIDHPADLEAARAQFAETTPVPARQSASL